MVLSLFYRVCFSFYLPIFLTDGRNDGVKENYPQNQVAAAVALGFLPVNADGTGVGVTLVTVVEETAVEASSRPLPSTKACLYLSVFGMFAQISCYLIIIMTSA
ncbi:hypothetical protein SCA6_008030 [Theobroma cacao]